jgi:hypothetical protein
MAKYQVYLHAIASATVTVEADSLDEARELAYEELPGGLCYQCSGGQFSDYSMEIGDFQLDAEEEYNGKLYPNAELVED